MLRLVHWRLLSQATDTLRCVDNQWYTSRRRWIPLLPPEVLIVEKEGQELQTYEGNVGSCLANGLCTLAIS